MATQDRERSHMLRNVEHRLVQYLCSRLPLWVTSNMLTAFGFSGSIIACAGLWLGAGKRFFLAALFVVVYGGAMIIALLRYKITNQFQIDSFYFSTTELRLLLAVVLLTEIFRPDTLLQFGVAGSLLLIVFNLLELYRLLRQADQKDRAEKSSDKNQEANLDLINVSVS